MNAFKESNSTQDPTATNAFHRIAEICPRIQSLSLDWLIDLQAPWQTDAVFKELISLDVDDILPPRVNRQARRNLGLPETNCTVDRNEIILMLGQRMPRLSELCQGGEWVSDRDKVYLNLVGGFSDRQWLEAPDPKPPGLPPYRGVKKRIMSEIFG